jgi:hypothetical protein
VGQALARVEDRPRGIAVYRSRDHTVPMGGHGDTARHPWLSRWAATSIPIGGLYAPDPHRSRSRSPTTGSAMGGSHGPSAWRWGLRSAPCTLPRGDEGDCHGSIEGLRSDPIGIPFPTDGTPRWSFGGHRSSFLTVPRGGSRDRALQRRGYRSTPIAVPFTGSEDRAIEIPRSRDLLNGTARSPERDRTISRKGLHDPPNRTARSSERDSAVGRRRLRARPRGTAVPGAIGPTEGGVGRPYRARMVLELGNREVEKGLRKLAHGWVRSPEDARDVLRAAFTPVVDPRSAPWDPARSTDIVSHVGRVMGKPDRQQKQGWSVNHEVLDPSATDEDRADDGAPSTAAPRLDPTNAPESRPPERR